MQRNQPRAPPQGRGKCDSDTRRTPVCMSLPVVVATKQGGTCIQAWG